MTKSTAGWLCFECGATENHPGTVVSKPESPAHTFAMPESLEKTSSVQSSLQVGKPRSRTGRNPKLIVATVIAVLALLSAYLVPLALAWRAFEAKLPTIKTSTLTGSLEFYGQDFLSAYDSRLDFHGALDRKQNPLALALDFDGTWAKQHYSGQSVVADNQLNFRLVSAHLPVIRVKQSAALVPLTEAWYRTAIDSRLFDNVCENRQPASHPDKLALYRLLKSTHLRPSLLNNPLAMIDGHRVVQLHGSVDNRNFAAITQAIASLLPDGCDLSTLGFTPADTAKMHLSYTFWTSKDYDRLRLSLEDKTLGSRLMLTLRGSGYNQPQTITPPPVATDLNALELASIKNLAK